MKNITKYLFENLKPIFEGVNKETKILDTLEKALEYFNVDLNSDQGRFIAAAYTIAPREVDKDGNEKLVSPFVASYDSKIGFAMRRWCKDNPELNEYIADNGINIETLFKTGNKDTNRTFKGYHNTNLEKISEFPTPAEEEYFVAMSLNVKANEGKNNELSMRYALFGEKYENKDIDESIKEIEEKLKDESLSKKERKSLEKQKEAALKDKEIYEKYWKYYEDHKKIIDKRAEGFKVKPGDLYKKLPNDAVKTTENWSKDGNYGDKNPDHTPKADVVSKSGDAVSVKSAVGAQAMSGGMNETAATLMSFVDLLDEETQMKLTDLFEDENGDPIDWSNANKERNYKLNKIIKDIFSNKEKNQEFIMAVITESLTGASKFGNDSLGTATSVITYNESNGTMYKEDMESYILNIFDKISATDVTINHKSGGNSIRAVMRMNLKPHPKKFDEKETADLKKKYSKLINVISKVRNNEYIKSKSNNDSDGDTEEAEVVDKKGNTIKVSIKTGPQGGKYYINSNNNRTYVQKGSGGKYEIRKN